MIIYYLLDIANRRSVGFTELAAHGAEFDGGLMKKYIKTAMCAMLAALLVIPAILGGCGLFSDSTIYAKVSEGNVSPAGFIYSLYENGDAEITGLKTDGVFPDLSGSGSENTWTECHLVIPDTVDSHPVTAIGADAFRENSALMYLTIGKNVKKIARSAFESCPALICIDGGAALEEIGDSAFSYCVSLCRIDTLPSLRAIDSAAFFGCTALSRFPRADKLASVGSQAFFGCTLLAEVRLPQSCTSLGRSAFEECTSLTYVDLGGVCEIPDSAFSGCISLVNAEFNKKTTSLGTLSFRGCSRLAAPALPGGVKTIDCRAFEGSKWLDDNSDEFVIVGDGILIRYNGTDANVEIPRGVKVIADAFSGNTVIRSVTIGGNVQRIDSYAFGGCTALGRAVISGNVKEIGEGAFGGCTTLSVLYLPASLGSVGKAAFGNCPNLTSVNFGGSAGKWNKINIASGNTALGSVVCGSKP